MIVFRLDANESIATGHMMRCMAIADCIRAKQESCMFLLSEDKETMRLRQAGFEYEILNTKWDDKESELPVIKKWLASRTDIRYLVVDSYQATYEYLKELNEIVPVMYFDDMELESYDVSVILHYGICIDETSYINKYKNTDTLVLAGKDYIPLRSEFMRLPPAAKRKKQIMITTGGTDTYSVAYCLAKLCAEDEFFRDYKLDVIVGSMCHDLKNLQEMARKYDNINISYNVNDMSVHMRECEIAVSAGGTTLLELCACATPAICFSFADNQRLGTETLGKLDIMPNAGDARFDDVPGRAVHLLKSILADKTMLDSYSRKVKGYVDGRGAFRIAEILLKN